MSENEPAQPLRSEKTIFSLGRFFHLENVMDYPTRAARVICEVVIPEWQNEFLRKNADYGETSDLLGAKGQFGEIWRKVGKLKRAMWDGAAMEFEGIDEILRDIIGHCALALFYQRAAQVADVVEPVEPAKSGKSGLPGLRPVMDEIAARESAQFIITNMQKANAFESQEALMRYAVERAPVGEALEFGVGTGRTLAMLTGMWKGSKQGDIYGFDSFAGLPEHWRPHFPAGTFAEEAPVFVQGAKVVQGLFADSLPWFFAAEADTGDLEIAFIHMDCDLYSSAKTAFDHCGKRLVSGAVILFDEFLNYPGWRYGECRAFLEWAELNEVEYEWIGYNENGQQVAVQLKGS